MTFSLETPTQLELSIDSATQIDHWRQAQVGSTPAAIWRMYLNQSCMDAFLPWLQAEYGAEIQGWQSDRDTWELVNGTAITWGNQRLIVIPDRAIDTSELRVPQEWVDIPSWAGDYYIAAQVNPDTGSVRLWGFTTHAQVQAGGYDPDDRTYAVDGQLLIQDLSVLWVVQQVYADESTRGTITPLAPLAAPQAENLGQRLANRAIEHPRLELPFPLWGALLSQTNWRQRLAQLRRGETPPVHLGEWLQNQFSVGWQALESLLTAEELALSFRQSPDTVAEVRRVKRLTLPEQELLPEQEVLPGQEILLVVGLAPEADNRVNVRVQLRPRDRSLWLLPNLMLEMLDTSGAVVQSVSAREADNLIQLRRFRCAPGSQFRLQVRIADYILGEDFWVG
jgi:Protein of unknown function (DUF1822)